LRRLHRHAQGDDPMSAPGPLWAEANQRYLAAALGVARGWISGKPGSSAEALDEAARAMPSAPALERLCAAFALSPFERGVLLLCAAVELDASFAGLLSAA